MNGINGIRCTVLIVLASLYDNKMCDEKRVKGKCGKKKEEELKHRVANPKLKAEGREEEGRQLLS